MPEPKPHRDVIEHRHYLDARLTRTLLSACKSARDLLIRCDAEIMPNDLIPATDDDWDRVAAELDRAIREAEQAGLN